MPFTILISERRSVESATIFHSPESSATSIMYSSANRSLYLPSRSRAQTMRSIVCTAGNSSVTHPVVWSAIQLLALPNLPSLMNSSWCLLETLLPEALRFTLSEARAMFLPCMSKISSSSMQGSKRFVFLIVNRTLRAFTGANRSTFSKALTDARSTPDRASGTKLATARSISRTRALISSISLRKASALSGWIGRSP